MILILGLGISAGAQDTTGVRLGLTYAAGTKPGVIVLTNADDANPGAIATQLMNTVGEAVAKAASEAPATTMKWDPSWSRFAPERTTQPPRPAAA